MSFDNRDWATSGYAVVGTAPGCRTYRWVGQEMGPGQEMTPEERRATAENLAALLNAHGDPVLTPNQEKALTAIREYISVNGFSPVPREIADACGISTAGADFICDRLADMGLILRAEKGVRRGRPISLPQQADRKGETA